MTEKEIKCSTWIQADIEQVWRAVNEPEQLAQWLFPPFLNAQIRRTGDDKAIMLMGPMEVPFMVFEAAEPPYRITVRGFPDRVLKATFGLEAENGGTAVTVIMSGFESLAEGGYEDRLGPSCDGWQKALENLKAYVSGAEQPFPQGYIASLLGYRLEREAKYAVERSIWLKAPRERVWQAITDPQQIQQWYSPTTPWRLTALEVGGKYTVYDAETDSEGHAQIIELLDPLHQLVLRSMPQSDDEVQDVTTYTLLPEANGTRLIIVNAGYEVEAVRHQSMEQNAFGFGMALENLQAFLAGENLPYPWGF